ncbi:IspD/TarI family cytidylyltransferase [Actinomyces sp. HMT 175]|uniref:IspD/TarI family cytidylyltransferase n=1 Tax=Actinomyces sp. HMT 175 TaxID=2789425 RepID=UPI0019179C23|nr:2-C-methyl-D-erythritol 4-phosphate cytidylyltransferase [Actinomyces sp. HMT 175]QQQ59533.1 2-C-methyl-D-erythritol 4-phosphate cytidylyltransferase [Actinomyces sp. HMT 175]
MSTSPSSQASAPPESAPGGAVAVLTAAGSGSRLGAGVPKALVPVGGVSLLRRAAAGFIASGAVSHVVVTAPAEEVDRFRAELEGLADGSVGTSVGRRSGIEVVAGSPRSRQASVALGLAAALAAVPRADVVIVHDAARALTPPEVTQRVVAAVRAGHEAVVPALPVTDTVKEVEARPAGEPEPVVGTPRRDRLRAVQTPQGFSTPVLVAAHRAGAERAGDEALAASDDAGLVEACGGSVVVVAGDERAMKVTTPMDLALAELLLERESAQGERPAGTGGEN